MALKGLFIETLGKASILLPHTNSSAHCFLNPLKPLLSSASALFPTWATFHSY